MVSGRETERCCCDVVIRCCVLNRSFMHLSPLRRIWLGRILTVRQWYPRQETIHEIKNILFGDDRKNTFSFANFDVFSSIPSDNAREGDGRAREKARERERERERERREHGESSTRR
jgi:hypothetical protein